MRVLLIHLAIMLPGIAFAEELRLPADQIESGQSAYARRCASCHGRDASGASGPDIKGILIDDVTSAVRGVEKMPRIELDESEAKVIATYLMSLAPDQAQKRLDNRER